MDIKTPTHLAYVATLPCGTLSAKLWPIFLDRPVFHLAAIIVVVALFPVAA